MNLICKIKTTRNENIFKHINSTTYPIARASKAKVMDCKRYVYNLNTTENVIFARR